MKRFEILEVNEYNTSKIYNKTFKEETERCIYVNRDKNACKNILYLGKYYLQYQSRPLEFCQKSKENKVVIKQRKSIKKKEIVV